PTSGRGGRLLPARSGDEPRLHPDKEPGCVTKRARSASLPGGEPRRAGVGTSHGCPPGCFRAGKQKRRALRAAPGVPLPRPATTLLVFFVRVLRRGLDLDGRLLVAFLGGDLELVALLQVVDLALLAVAG